jgi:nucleoside-diphosphate-sugar epimerase
MSHRPCLFLTGATGLIGTKLLGRLLDADPHRQVIVLARRAASVGFADSGRVSILAGDLTAPGLGLAEDDRRALAGSITEILHCAADIRFDLPLLQAQEVNTRGTSRVLDLARACGHLKKFAYISTVYVAGKTPGPWPEARRTNTDGFFNTYQQSKYEAEELVAEAMPEIPAAVFRLSSIIGDSATGTVDQFNYFHRLLKFVPRNPYPIMPGIPDARVDLIASDWAVAALSCLYEADFHPGRFYNLSAGPSHSLTVREIVEMTFEHISSHRPLPEIVSLEEVERFVQSRINAGDRRIQALFGVVSLFLPHLAIRQHFENTQTLAALAARGIRLPPIRSYYPKVIEYCLGRVRCD